MRLQTLPPRMFSSSSAVNAKSILSNGSDSGDDGGDDAGDAVADGGVAVAAVLLLLLFCAARTRARSESLGNASAGIAAAFAAVRDVAAGTAGAAIGGPAKAVTIRVGDVAAGVAIGEPDKAVTIRVGDVAAGGSGGVAGGSVRTPRGVEGLMKKGRMTSAGGLARGFGRGSPADIQNGRQVDTLKGSAIGLRGFGNGRLIGLMAAAGITSSPSLSKTKSTSERSMSMRQQKPLEANGTTLRQREPLETTKIQHEQHPNPH